MENKTNLCNLKLTIVKIRKNLDFKKAASNEDNPDTHTLRFTELILDLLIKDSKSFPDYEDILFIFSFLLSLNKGHKYGVSFYANKAANFSKQLSNAQKRAKSICDYFQEHIKRKNALKGLIFVFDDLFVFQIKEKSFDADINIKNIGNLFKPLNAPFHLKIEPSFTSENSQHLFYEKIVKGLDNLDIDEYLNYVSIK